MQAVISPASAVESSPRVCASQIRNSTVPKSWCGRTLHQSCVCSTIEFVADQEVDEVRVAGPVPERLMHATAREALREDLRPRGMQAGVAPVEERRVRRDRQQVGQQCAQVVAHGDRAVGAAHAHVNVEREGVVAPRDVLEPLLAAAVVLGVDDPLLLPRAPRMRAGGGQADALRRPRAGTDASRASCCCATASAKVAPLPDLISISDAISSPVIDSASGGSASAAAWSSSNRFARSSVSGSRIWNSSSIPTVKSSDSSKTSRARCMSSIRSNRSRGRRAGRRRGSRCAPSPRAAPEAAPPSS